MGTFILGLVIGLVVAGVFAFNYRNKFNSLVNKSAEGIRNMRE